jgi:hypothetical protein
MFFSTNFLESAPHPQCLASPKKIRVIGELARLNLFVTYTPLVNRRTFAPPPARPCSPTVTPLTHPSVHLANHFTFSEGPFLVLGQPLPDWTPMAVSFLGGTSHDGGGCSAEQPPIYSGEISSLRGLPCCSSPSCFSCPGHLPIAGPNQPMPTIMFMLLTTVQGA